MDDVGEEGVARRDPQPACSPGPGAQQPDLPHRCRCTGARRQDGGGGVAADSHASPAMRIVGQSATREAGDPGEPVAHPLDEPERGGGRPQGRGEQARQQRSGDLVADVGEEARGADPCDAGSQPPLVGQLLVVHAHRRSLGLPSGSGQAQEASDEPIRGRRDHGDRDECRVHTMTSWLGIDPVLEATR